MTGFFGVYHEYAYLPIIYADGQAGGAPLWRRLSPLCSMSPPHAVNRRRAQAITAHNAAGSRTSPA